MVVGRRGVSARGGMTRGIQTRGLPLSNGLRFRRPLPRFIPPRGPPPPRRPPTASICQDLLEFDLIDIDDEIEVEMEVDLGKALETAMSTVPISFLRTILPVASTTTTTAATAETANTVVERTHDLATYQFDFDFPTPGISDDTRCDGSVPPRPLSFLSPTSPKPSPSTTTSPPTSPDRWIAAGLPTLSSESESTESDEHFESAWPYVDSDDAIDPLKTVAFLAHNQNVAYPEASLASRFDACRSSLRTKVVTPKRISAGVFTGKTLHTRIGPPYRQAIQPPSRNLQTQICWPLPPRYRPAGVLQRPPPRLIHPLPRKPFIPLLANPAGNRFRAPIASPLTPSLAERILPPAVRPSTSKNRRVGPITGGPPLPDQLEDFSRYLLPGMSELSLDELRSGSAFHAYHRTRSLRLDCVPIHRDGPPNRLQQDMIESWCRAEPSPTQKAMIDKLLAHLTYMINEYGPVGNNPNRQRFQVDVFGSLAWGGGAGDSSDLDLVVIDTFNPQGYTPQFWSVPYGESASRSKGKGSARRPNFPIGVPKVYNMDTLGAILGKAGMQRIRRISWAHTPIVKFLPPASNLECDINVNDLGGWYNSSLILTYCNINPHVFRPMIHTLKIWAKSHKVNNPSGNGDVASLSSYCLTLMAIVYLQIIGVLPNLQAKVRVPERLNDADMTECQDVIWTSWGRPQGSKARIFYDKRPPAGWRSAKPNLTAAEAVTGFFAFMDGDKRAAGGFQPARQGLSILNGGIIKRAYNFGQWQEGRIAERRRLGTLGLDRPELIARMKEFDTRRDAECDVRLMGKGNGAIQPRRWCESSLLVQDPFIWSKNCAAGMSADGSDRFWKAIAATHNMLKRRPHPTLADILSA